MPEQPNQLELAIFKTILYGDIFDFPMTVPEIHHFMIAQPADLETVRTTLAQSAWLGQRLIRVNGFYAARQQAAEQREYRKQIVEPLWNGAQQYGRWMAHLPFVRMVALTGAIAMQNPQSPSDDFDYLLVTRIGRVWLTRLLAVILVRLARLWGVELCPNYVMSDAVLEQQRRNLYTAHEVVQMVPISGHDLYQRIRAANTWADQEMPNARDTFYPLPAYEPHGLGRWLKRSGEWLLGGRFGDWLEHWEQHRKEPKFAAETARYDETAAQIDADHVKGHFQDYGQEVLRRFESRLREHGIDR